MSDQRGWVLAAVPLWIFLAAGTLGSMQTTGGLYDNALSNLHEVRELADRLDSAWLAAWSRVLMGTVAILQDRLVQARELLDEALAQSAGADSTGSMGLCLMAFARLALAEGDPERAALLAGAAGACDSGPASRRGRCYGRPRPH